MLQLLMFFTASSLSILNEISTSPSSSPLTCPKYVCMDSTTTSDLFSICLLYSPSSKSTPETFSSIGCKHEMFFNNFCDLSNLNTSDPSTYKVPCVEPTMNYTDLYPGEGPCYSDSNCINSVCINSICTGSSLSQPCTNTYQCQPGLVCKKNIYTNVLSCLESIRPNQTGCVVDTDCVNSAGCDFNITTGVGTCKRYFSVPNFKNVSTCANNTSVICESGQCEAIMRSNESQCVPAYVSKNKLPKSCTSDQDCVDKNGTHYTSCGCGANEAQTAYCKPFYGDAIGVNYIRMLKEFFSSKTVLTCAAERRNNMNCWRKWKSKSYDMLRFYYFQYMMYEVIQNNDDCVKDVFTYQYWDSYGNLKYSSEGQLAKIAIVLIGWYLF